MSQDAAKPHARTLAPPAYRAALRGFDETAVAARNAAADARTLADLVAKHSTKKNKTEE